MSNLLFPSAICFFQGCFMLWSLYPHTRSLYHQHSLCSTADRLNQWRAWLLKNPSLSASRMATKRHSGISRPSRSKLIPTRISNPPTANHGWFQSASSVSISECKYLTFSPFSAIYSVRSSAIFLVKVVTRILPPSATTRWHSFIRVVNLEFCPANFNRRVYQSCWPDNLLNELPEVCSTSSPWCRWNINCLQAHFIPFFKFQGGYPVPTAIWIHNPPELFFLPCRHYTCLPIVRSSHDFHPQIKAPSGKYSNNVGGFLLRDRSGNGNSFQSPDTFRLPSAFQGQRLRVVPNVVLQEVSLGH